MTQQPFSRSTTLQKRRGTISSKRNELIFSKLKRRVPTIQKPSRNPHRVRTLFSSGMRKINEYDPRGLAPKQFSNHFCEIDKHLLQSWLKAERKEHKFSSRDMAVFPIYATVPSKNDKSPQRLISGIMIREPHHARNPTDDVNVLTIELLTRDSPTWTFCHNINRAIIAQCSNFILVASQNSMKKIDPIHLTFN